MVGTGDKTGPRLCHNVVQEDKERFPIAQAIFSQSELFSHPDQKQTLAVLFEA